MRSNRLVQTIIQAAMLVLLTAIVVKLSSPGASRVGGHAGGGASAPSKDELRRCYREYFQSHEEVSRKAEFAGVEVTGVSVDNSVAYAKLRIEFRWESHNPEFTDGPLKNAPGKRGDTVVYTEVFKFRQWDTGWAIEGHLPRPEIR